MPKPFSKIRSAAIDGRLHNPIYRKCQLKALHDALTKSLPEIQRVIAKDTGNQSTEVKVECWLAMRAIADAYTALDTEKALEEEYALAHGKDSPDAREPVGVVVIEPTSHTFFYSLITALVPALAAGNCVILQVEQSMLETPTYVLKLVENALDADVIHISRTKVNAADIAHRHIRIVSRPGALVAAVVERDADIQAAAKALVAMRFGLRGKSPYAPDIVLVNEWVKKDFLMAARQHSIQFISDGPQQPVAGGRKLEAMGLLDEIVKEGFSNVVSAGHDGIILEIENRKSFLTQRKLQEKCLGVLAVSSMDDAIDTARKLGRLSAAYIFTTPAAAKYICDFVDADLCFVNHVPTNLLFGPVAPVGKPLDHAEGTRYPTSLFTVPKPRYITKPALISRIESILAGAVSPQLHKLEAEASAPLPDMKRPERQNGIGFFHQGIVTGGILVLSAIISTTGGLAYCGFKYLWPFVRAL
ncbi:unnamed protein product [Parascedosporium putredinis]|uniref:Aldehyde dehydrogenase domain-containing protein n=1 Tax=Parascedosporium putredinis TaxID=1442378 RepID=A0A9P1H184_9PEZI|nr:unnamed protein product [Parascedosporium putredinis]CAI7993487.1 unnamed protein product [Parascedosporium putredinis]